VGHLTHMGERRNAFKFYMENLKRRDNIGCLGIILE
jgi:hypothetical protein